MENEQFYSLLKECLDIPFDIEKVTVVEENCGTVWIQTNEGKVYYLQIQKCEEDEDG